MNSHPTLMTLRMATADREAGERNYRTGIVNALDARAAGRFTADDVAEAAGVSRARVYQILDEEKGRVA